jgi:hypothetical protein
MKRGVLYWFDGSLCSSAWAPLAAISEREVNAARIALISPAQRRSGLIAYATVALAFVTLGLAFYTAKLWRAAVSLGREAKDAAKRQSGEMKMRRYDRALTFGGALASAVANRDVRIVEVGRDREAICAGTDSVDQACAFCFF